MFKPYGNNVLFEPKSKEKIIGDTSRFFLYGKVLAIGDKVEGLKVGDTIGVTQWALNKVVLADKSEHFFVPADGDFILGVLHEA